MITQEQEIAQKLKENRIEKIQKGTFYQMSLVQTLRNKDNKDKCNDLLERIKANHNEILNLIDEVSK